MPLRREWLADIEGRRSSRPAPSLRRRPWRALEGAPHDWALAADASSWSRASCSASSRPERPEAEARRGPSSPEEPGLEPPEPPALEAWWVAEEEPAWLGGADAREPDKALLSLGWSDIGVDDLRFREAEARDLIATCTHKRPRVVRERASKWRWADRAWAGVGGRGRAWRRCDASRGHAAAWQRGRSWA